MILFPMFLPISCGKNMENKNMKTSQIILNLKGSLMCKKKASAKRTKSAISAKAVKKKSKGKTATKKSSATRKPAARKAAKEPEVSLGRPLVTQEEKLYMLFKDDYHARQIFEFLRVNTLKELEELSPQQIVRRVSKPVFDTVDRIRQTLAEMKRSLRDDEAYAKEYRDHTK